MLHKSKSQQLIIRSIARWFRFAIERKGLPHCLFERPPQKAVHCEDESLEMLTPVVISDTQASEPPNGTHADPALCKEFTGSRTAPVLPGCTPQPSPGLFYTP